MYLGYHRSLSDFMGQKIQNFLTTCINVNTFLHILDQETSYITVADNSNLEVKGEIRRSLFKDDGYHLNRGGLKVLAANLKSAIHPTVGLGTYNRGRRGRNNTPQQMGNTSNPGSRQTTPTQGSKEPWNGRQAQIPPSQRNRERTDRQVPAQPPQKFREPWDGRHAQIPSSGRSMGPWNETETQKQRGWDSAHPTTPRHAQSETQPGDHTGYSRGVNQHARRVHQPRPQPGRDMEWWGPANESDGWRRDRFPPFPSFHGYNDLHMNWYREDSNGLRPWFHPEPYRDYPWRRDYDFVGY